MTFPGAGRAVLIGGSLGGGTGRTTDWSTYNGNNDSAWQQWVDDSSTALGTTYQTIKGFKNTALPTSGSTFFGVDNNGTQTVAKFVPDTDDATSGQFTLGSFHNLGTDRVQLLSTPTTSNMVLTSAVDSGTIVVFDGSGTDSGKISGLAGIAGSDWDAVMVDTTTSNGGDGSPYNYTNGWWHSPADLIVWTMRSGSGNRTGFSWQLWLKGNYTNQGTNGSGRDGINELLTTPSQSPYYGESTNSQNHHYGDLLDLGNTDNHNNHIHWMRNHLEEDSGLPSDEYDLMFSKRQTERFFMSMKFYNNDETTTHNAFKMMLMNHYSYQGQGGWGGTTGASTTLHSENTYRSNSDVTYYKPTGRSINNVNNDNHVSMVKGKSMIQVYNDESGTLGGNIYVTAMTDTTETASSEHNPTAHDGGVAEMFRFDEVTANDTHSTNAKIISTTNSSDSTNTSFDPEALCIGDLHSDYFGVAWRQGTTAYISIFEIQEQTSDMPVLTRVADSINLGTVPNAGRMALSKLGNGVAVLTCGNYYRIIKTNAV
jgi:hypothetical protein